MQPLQLGSTLRHGTVILTHWNFASLISWTSRAVDSGYPIRYAPMPYSGLAAGGTGTRTGAVDGDPVLGPSGGVVGVVPWAMLVVGSKVARITANASTAVKRLNMLISVEVLGRRRRPGVAAKSMPRESL
jgi:hypothetical protein